jgi:hypothetical protein
LNRYVLKMNVRKDLLYIRESGSFSSYLEEKSKVSTVATALLGSNTGILQPHRCHNGGYVIDHMLERPGTGWWSSVGCD